MEQCELCPRRCHVDRVKHLGFCKAGENLRVGLVSLHEWEEPCLVGEHGAGTIFFSHCNLRCVYCQNFSISHENFGAEISVERLAEIFIEQQKRGAANIELVTPTHYTDKICAAIDIAKTRGLNLPIVWNSNAYENISTLELLRGRVDIFLPDLKYFDDEPAKNFSNAPNYFAVASAAVKKMFELVGAAQIVNGKMIRGIIVRHLILPNFRRDAIKIVDWLYETFGDKIFISLMNQYTPIFRAAEFKKINRPLTTFEYDSVVEHAINIGVKNCFIQVGKTADKNFIPNFNLDGVKKISGST
ncbi:MAG: radical SAM protein [Selenomonadaceae bacterium]|nr:radical SAM protein [Selenomonadaceae bacterium]